MARADAGLMADLTAIYEADLDRISKMEGVRLLAA